MPHTNPISPALPSIPDACPRCGDALVGGDRPYADAITAETGDTFDIVHVACLTTEEAMYMDDLHRSMDIPLMCNACGRDMRPDECGDEDASERVCDTCAGIS